MPVDIPIPVPRMRSRKSLDKDKIDRHVAMATIQISSYMDTAETTDDRIKVAAALSILSTASSMNRFGEARRLVKIAKSMVTI